MYKVMKNARLTSKTSVEHLLLQFPVGGLFAVFVPGLWWFSRLSSLLPIDIGTTHHTKSVHAAADRSQRHTSRSPALRLLSEVVGDGHPSGYPAVLVVTRFHGCRHLSRACLFALDFADIGKF